MPDDTSVEHKQGTGEHDSGVKQCANCNWWLKALVSKEQQKAWGEQQFQFGECRAVPPTALPGNRVYEAAGEAGKPKATVSIKQARFPHTYHDDWCGAWTAKDSG